MVTHVWRLEEHGLWVHIFCVLLIEQLMLIDVQVLCGGLPAVQVRRLHIPQVLQPANHLPRAGRGGDALLTHLFPHLHQHLHPHLLLLRLRPLLPNLQAVSGSAEDAR